MATHTYSVVLDFDAEARMYTVTVPALPGCTTQGSSREQCAERAREAISAHIAGMHADRVPVPVESQPAEIIQVSVDA